MASLQQNCAPKAMAGVRFSLLSWGEPYREGHNVSLGEGGPKRGGWFMYKRKSLMNLASETLMSTYLWHSLWGFLDVI